MENNLFWIDKSDKEFLNIFIESVKYIESKDGNKNKYDDIFDSISKQPSNQESIKEHAQFYTPADVALYTAYQLLKNFDYKTQIVFDPCAGKGSLLIAVGIVLATKYKLKDAELLNKLYGTEICLDTYNETIDNIVNGLSRWITNISLQEAKNILLKNIEHNDFLNIQIPKDSHLIVNPPYKEVKGQGNIWINFAEKITSDINVKSFGMIVPISICSATRTTNIRDNILNSFKEIVALHHDTRPRPLFKNIEQRITILIAHKNSKENKYFTTGFIGHKSGERISVWENEFTALDYKYCKDVFPKMTDNDLNFFKTHFNPEETLSKYTQETNNQEIWVRTTGRYSLLAQHEKPDEITSKWKKVSISKNGANIIINDFKDGTALRWWKIFGDGRDISIKKFINNYSVERVS